MFTGYLFERRSLQELGAAAGLSSAEVCRVLYEVDAQVARSSSAGLESKAILLESPLEELVLSQRARNALRGLGCETVRDVLRLDLFGPARGIGRKTRTEVLEALRGSGLAHPRRNEPAELEIRRLDRRLERMRHRISAALGSVAREIDTVQKTLRRRMGSRKCGPADGVSSP